MVVATFVSVAIVAAFLTAPVQLSRDGLDIAGSY